LGRYADDHGCGRDVCQDHRAGTNYGTLADGHAGQQDGAGADQRAAPDANATSQRHARRYVGVIADHHVMVNHGPVVDDRA
jgi:hypothetical protein